MCQFEKSLHFTPDGVRTAARRYYKHFPPHGGNILPSQGRWRRASKKALSRLPLQSTGTTDFHLRKASRNVVAANAICITNYDLRKQLEVTKCRLREWQATPEWRRKR